MGYSALPSTELFSRIPSGRLSAPRARRSFRPTEQGPRATAAAKARGKDFLVRKYDVALDGAARQPLALRLSLPQLLDIANQYLQLWSKLEYLDLWYSLPVGESAERKASQIWHRDFNDRHLLKVFLYLSDVDERSGPFEYVPGSQPGGRYGASIRGQPMGVGRISDKELAKHVQTDDVRDVHGAGRDDHLLQHERPAPRRLRRGKPRVLAP